jgi:hypothetical protein
VKLTPFAELVASLQLAQVGEQRRDLPGNVLVSCDRRRYVTTHDARPDPRVPVTLVFRIDAPRHQLARDALDATLEADATTEVESIRIGELERVAEVGSRAADGSKTSSGLGRHSASGVSSTTGITRVVRSW